MVPLAPDTLLVWDGPLRRISLFTTDGRFVRASRIETQLPNPFFRGLLEDRTILVSGTYYDIPESGLGQSHVRILRLDLDGQVVDSAGRYP